jgi:hypothetical protein
VVVIVKVGLAGGVTELRMEHVAPLISSGATVHDNATEPLETLLMVPTVTVEIEDPPGSTAEGWAADAASVKFACPYARGTMTTTAMTKNRTVTMCRAACLELSMSRFD